MAWINNARILAAFAVILLHVSADVWMRSLNVDGASWWIAHIYDSFLRWCVPVFVMISGYLLLDPKKEDEGIGFFYKKRASRILIPLIYWSFIYSLWAYYTAGIKGQSVTVGELFASFAAGKPYFHLWFLFMLLGLYVFTPFLRKLIKNLTDGQLGLLCLLAFLFAGVFSALDKPYDERTGPFITWFLLYLPFFLSGYFVGRVDTRRYFGWFAGVFAVLVILTAAGVWMILRWVGRGTDTNDAMYFYDYLSVTVIPMSVCAFGMLKRLGKPLFGQSLTKKLAGWSLGIYLVHILWLELFHHFGLHGLAFNPVLAIPVSAAVIFTASAINTLVLTKIPLLSKVV